MTIDKAGPLHIDGTRLRDSDGREVILRGVNLGGDSKLPWPDGGTHVPTDFSDHREVSFVGRPFPIEEAGEHLGRLARWGFNCLRLLTTWEAVEHAGPGIYDTAYLDYFTEVVRRAGDHGFHVFIDFHQDVWSRMSGGSGAPGWTFDVVGLDFRRFQAADAAIVMQAAVDFGNPDPHQASYPQMVWSSNYQLPANGIMWTLFWLGRHATPDFLIEGVNVQDYLQRHYLGAVEQVAMRVRDMPHVIGFDTLNEPGTGWVGLPLSRSVTDPHHPSPVPLKPGPVWTPLDCLAAAQGRRVTLPVLARGADGRLTAVDEREFNRNEISIWAEGRACPFEAAGIYALTDGAVRPVAEHAFDHFEGRAISLADDCYAPFFHDVARTIRRHREDWILFAEMDPFAAIKRRGYPEHMPGRWVNAAHWYDIAMLYSKRFSPQTSIDIVSGEPDRDLAGLGRRYLRQLSGYAVQSEARGVPTLIGEFGIPYDLDDGRAYRDWAEGGRDTSIWDDHSSALSLMYDAIDALRIHATQWNYTASNRNDAWVGDGWNQEDLSIFSCDQIGDAADLDGGARALAGFSRPFVRAAQGIVAHMRFDGETRSFAATIDVDPMISAPTIIHLPRHVFGGDFRIEIDEKVATWQFDARNRLLMVHGLVAGTLPIAVRVG
ncbi:MAG TPA: cellulase family glycosylhydrolase [Sphingopyxis sp.]|nr:cellulase family glycosylhydrolase [Sphingopyxis sp.]